MNEHPATLLRCVVERITYQNPENGYSVLKVKVKGYSDLVTLVGNLLEVPVGSVLLCRGEWKVDKCYGSQFVAATWEETMPATVYGIEKYLGSGLVKGIGPRFARAIVQRFGTETIDIIETEIERLYEDPRELGEAERHQERHALSAGLRREHGLCGQNLPGIRQGEY